MWNGVAECRGDTDLMATTRRMRMRMVGCVVAAAGHGGE